MAELERLERALRAADQAGDTQAAQTFAQEIRRLQAEGQGTGTFEYIDNVVRQIANGLTFGFSDEISAGLNASPALVDDRDFSEVYSQNLEAERAKDRAFEEQNPVVSTVAEIGGAIPTAMIPFGAAGRVAQGAGMGSKMLTGGAIGAGQGAVYGFGEGEGGAGERADNALAGLLMGGALGGAAPVVTGAGSRVLNQTQNARLARQAARTAPTTEQLRQQSQQAFRKADEVGNIVPEQGTQLAQDFQNTVWDIIDDVSAKGFDPQLHPGVQRVLDRMVDEAAGGSGTQLTTLRELAQGVADSSDKHTAMLGRAMRDRLDEFLGTLPEGGALGEGLRLWGQFRRSQVIDEAVERAGLARSGLQSGLVNEFRRILNNQNMRRSFSTEEQQAMRDFVRGSLTRRVVSLLGKFGFDIDSPGSVRNFVGGSIGAGFGGVAGGPVGAVAVPALGTAARKVGDRMAQSGVDDLSALIRSGVLRDNNASQYLNQRLLELIVQRLSGPVAGQNAEMVPLSAFTGAQ